MSITPILSNLERLSSTFNEDGEAFDAGCNELDIEQYKEYCHKLFPFKKVCVVKSWTWWDIDVSELEQQLLHKNGQYPALIKANTVIDDEAGRFSYGDWVRTSPLVSFTDNCVFETKNTVYLIVGKGSRKTVSFDVAISYF